MSDLFAGSENPTAGRSARATRDSSIQDDTSIISIGGHNLRTRDNMGRSIRGREQQLQQQQQQQQQRPRSLFSPTGQRAPGAEVPRVLNLENIQDGPHPLQEYSDDDGYDDDDVEDVNNFGFGDDNGLNEGNTTNTVNPGVQQPVVTFTLPPNLPPTQQAAIQPPPQQASTTHPGQPPPQPNPNPPPAACPPPRHSALAAAALRLEQRVGHTLSTDVDWQSSVKGEVARIKTYRNEVLQSRDLVVFAYMRPGATTIQLLHSATTFSLHGGDPELRGSDFAFIGDRVGMRNPAAVLLQPDQPWKWDVKKAVLDSGRLELFYANPENAAKLWKPADAAAAEQNASVPRLLALPPPLIRFCAEGKRTPFAMHQHVIQLVTSQGHDELLQKCQLILDWCMVASHYDTSPTTSILALTMRAAPADDDILDDWLQRQLCHTLGPAQPTPHSVAPPVTTTPTATTATANAGAPNGGAAASTSLGAPTDVWAQVAAQLSQGMVNVAAALQPVPATSIVAASYEEGGKFYDEYQLAILKGFSHTHQIALVPPIWPMFQHTKHMDTHRDNILRKMKEWAVRPENQVNIDRSLYLSNNSLKEILSLRFNPGGTTAELYSVDSGISILMCRPLTTEARTAIRRREQAEERSRNTRTLAEDEAMQNERISTTCPESYDELLRCLGTYCALLHTLFGKRCMFFQHCFLLWEAMNSDYVLERRSHFTALFCRQVVWAIVEEGRAYFSKRMSPDDFAGVNPYDLKFPRSSLHTLEDFVRQQTPILRGSFPASWEGRGLVSGTRTIMPPTVAPPMQSVQLGSVTPTVVSGISANTGQRTAGGTNQRAVVIRSTNVHQAIKTVMEPFIARCNGTLLGPMLERLNITVADLPQIPGRRVCYNFVLGRCSQNGCRNRDGHVNVADLPEDFVTSLMDTLRPSITHFMSAGAPAPRVFSPRRRRREE